MKYEEKLHIYGLVLCLAERFSKSASVCLHLGNGLTAHLGSSTVWLVSKKESIHRSSRNIKDMEIIAWGDFSIFVCLFLCNEVGRILLACEPANLFREDCPVGFGII